MARPIAFWSLVAVLFVATVGSKALLGASNDLAESQMASESLRAFLAAHAEGAPARAPIKPNVDIWMGWRFRAGGCEAVAWPAPRNGEMDAQLRSNAGPSDAVAYVYDGAVHRQAPAPQGAWDYAAFRVLLPLGLAKGRHAAYVVLEHPTGCAASETLPWDKL
jgi:hypothetical protein